jgi:hypothetical protein
VWYMVPDNMSEITGDDMVADTEDCGSFYAGDSFYPDVDADSPIATVGFYERNHPECSLSTEGQSTVLTEHPDYPEVTGAWEEYFHEGDWLVPEVEASGESWIVEARNHRARMFPSSEDEDFFPASRDDELFPAAFDWHPFTDREVIMPTGHVYAGTPEDPVPGNPMDYDNQIYFRVRFKASNTQGIVSKFDVHHYRNRIEESRDDFTVASAGNVYLPFSQKFSYFRYVQVSIRPAAGAESGYYVKILDKNPGWNGTTLRGPRVAVYDSSDNRVEAAIDYTLIGW